MTHAPATIKGKIRRRKIRAIEEVICVMFGIVSFLIFCYVTSALAEWFALAIAITGAG